MKHVPQNRFRFLVRCFGWMLLAAFAAGAFATTSTNSESRVALVIGNADYVQGRLGNPLNDARAMAGRLRHLGFNVILRENLKIRELGSIYREFRSKIVPGGVALVFYAGHGVQFRGQNYFPAIDADIASEEDVPLQSLHLGTLLDSMEEANAGFSLVFLDACRDNPYARRFRSGSRGLAKVETSSSTLIHYATRPGSVAADGTGKNGTYTEALLAQIAEEGVPVEQMIKRVTNQVIAATNGRQEPWLEGSLRGDFYFAPKAATPPQPPPVQLDPEIETWRVADSVGSIAGYRIYLNEYPNGRFSAAARIKISEIEKREQEEAAAQRERDAAAQVAREAAAQREREAAALAARPPAPQNVRELHAAAPTDPAGAALGSGQLQTRYRDGGDGTLIDTLTGLQWQRCALGQTWDSGSCRGTAQTHNFDSAVAAVQALADAGGWRLPSIDELKSLVYCSTGLPTRWNVSGSPCDRASRAPTIDSGAFPNTPRSYFWTGTRFAVFSSDKWLVNFENGGADGYTTGSEGKVRLVRSVKR